MKQPMKHDRKSIDAAVTKNLLDDFDRFEQFAVAHQKSFLYGGLAVVAAVGIVFGVITYQQRAENAAAQMLANAVTEEQLIAAIDKYPSNGAANFARLRLARIYWKAGKNEQAIQILGDVHGALYMNSRVQLDHAYLLEKSGKNAEAAAAFAAAAEEASLPPELLAEALYGAGRLQLALGKKEQALEFLNRAASAPAVGDSNFGTLFQNLALTLRLTASAK